jgi:diguanylate cyclase (GGDEF)-like protein
MAGYGLFTVAIFRIIFLKNRSRGNAGKFFSLMQWVFASMVVASIAVEHATFLKLFWGVSVVAIIASTSFIAHSAFNNRLKKHLKFYALAWASMTLGMLSEIGFQLGIGEHHNFVNSQSASILSAILMSLALAHNLREEKSARRDAQIRSIKNLKKFQSSFNSIPIGLFTLNQSGSVILSNPEFSVIFKLGDTKSTGKSIDEFLGRSATQLLLESLRNSTTADIELVVSNDDEHRCFLVRISDTGLSLEGSVQDITQKKKAETQLRNLVDHDHLTGSLNRRGLETAVATALTEVTDGVPCAIAHVDIDRFKLFNDLHGFGTGDQLLQQLARRIEAVSRGRDNIARVADSFVIVLHDCSEGAAVTAMERVRSAIANEPFEVEGKALQVTCSIGIVEVDTHSNYVDLMAAAGRASSEAKGRGRNCVVRLNEQDATLRSHLEELKVVADLQRRIPTDRYFLEFQPIVALMAPASSLSYEVLIRMRGEDGSVVPPSRFIGAAERHGLMSQIDRWVLRNTLEWLDMHPQHRDQLAFATLNLSGASLNDSRFVDDAFSMISDHPQAAAKLCFEITESVALHDVGSTRRFADRIRSHGSRLALDDFGAGYTSFNYLKEIPADYIKIDGSFVKDINRNPANYSITRTIVELTHELGMQSIAEWAETPDTIAALLELHVDYAQGFGLVRPCAPQTLVNAHSGRELLRDPAVIMLLDEALPRSARHATGQTRRHIAIS